MILRFHQYNEELNHEEDFKSIMDRISKVGYISKSNQNVLNQIFKDYRFTDIIIERIKVINEFFSKVKIDYIEDVLVEYFDSTGYDYEVKFGYYLPNSKYYYNSYRSKDDKHNLFKKDYFESNDKDNYLLLSILEFLQKVSSEYYKDNLRQIEEIRKRAEEREGKTIKDWEKNYFKDRKTIDYFFKEVSKKVNQINPIILVKAKHKQKDEYCNVIYNVIWDPEEFNWSRKLEYNQIRNIADQIEKNTRLLKLGLQNCSADADAGLVIDTYYSRETGILDFEIGLFFKL